MKTKSKRSISPVFDWAKTNLKFKSALDPAPKSKRLLALEKKRLQWEESLRGLGRTSGLMLAAPPDSFYVWCNKQLDYPLRLARHLKRTDLAIIAPTWIQPRNVLGHHRAFITDHATELTGEQYNLLAYHHKRIKFDLSAHYTKDWNAGNCAGK